ncbi:MAG: LysR family transcriptional regulator [Acidimicrobiales bacterium]
MELRQLRALLAVSEHGSFSAAADALDTVQSNVSAHISKLEGELNAVLFDRRAGTLTEEGHVVIKRARTVLSETEQIFTDVSSLRVDVKGKVRIGIIGTTARWLIPLISEQVRTSHPNLQIEYLEATSSSLLRWIHDEILDVGILNAPVHSSEVTFRSIFEEVMVLTVPPGSALSEKKEVTIRDLGEVPLIAPPRGSWFRDELDAVAAKYRTALNIALEIDGLRLIAALAADGYGSAIVPATAITPTMRTMVSVIPISDLPPRSVGIARRKNRIESSATKATVLIVDDLFRLQRHRLPEGVVTLR